MAVTTPSKNVAHEAGCAEMKLAQALLPGFAQPSTPAAGRRGRRRAARRCIVAVVESCTDGGDKGGKCLLPLDSDYLRVQSVGYQRQSRLLFFLASLLPWFKESSQRGRGRF